MSPVIELGEVTVLSSDGSGKPLACGGCTHPREMHDGIATRYCAATASGALSRGCVCKVPAVAG